MHTVICREYPVRVFKLLRNNLAVPNIKSLVFVQKHKESFLTLSGRSGMLLRGIGMRARAWNTLEFVFCDIFRSLNLISDHERIRIAWQEAACVVTATTLSYR